MLKQGYSLTSLLVTLSGTPLCDLRAQFHCLWNGGGEVPISVWNISACLPTTASSTCWCRPSKEVPSSWGGGHWVCSQGSHLRGAVVRKGWGLGVRWGHCRTQVIKAWLHRGQGARPGARSPWARPGPPRGSPHCRGACECRSTGAGAPYRSTAPGAGSPVPRAC